MSKVLIGMDRSGSLHIYIAVTTDMIQQVADIHRATPLASVGLGCVLTAAGLTGIMLKDPDNKLTVIFKGDGPVNCRASSA